MRLSYLPMAESDQSDDDLLAATTRGEERAFALLVSRHADKLRGLAFRLTGNSADADDLVQEAFCRAFVQARTWRHEGIRFSTWLYRVVTNLAFDRSRRLKTRRLVALDAVAEPIDERPDALDNMNENERRQAVNKAISNLPERQRQVVVLTYGEGLSNAEVAGMIGITIEAVEAALTRARISLRDQLRESGWMTEEKENERRSRPLHRA